MNTLLGVIYGISYIASSAGETLVVKALNYGSAPLQLPAYTSLLSNQLWIFLLHIYVYLLAEKIGDTIVNKQNKVLLHITIWK